MPTSKKPRKKYRKRRISIGYTQEEIDRNRNFYQCTEYALLEKLPRGEATQKEVDAMFKSFNCVVVSISSRKDLSDTQKREILEIVHPATIAIASILNRGKKTSHFVGTGDELRLIIEASHPVFQYIDESLNFCPTIFSKERDIVEYLCGNEG